MAVKNTKYVDVIVTKKIDDVRVENGKKEHLKIGGIIFKDGKPYDKMLSIKLDEKVSIPENFVGYIKKIKIFKDGDYVQRYFVEKVGKDD